MCGQSGVGAVCCGLGDATDGGMQTKDQRAICGTPGIE